MAEHKIDTAALLSGVDIVDVIDAHVPLRKSGAEYEACCPFHNEATPSFKVNPEKQFYHCFGCGAHGDAIGFLMAHKGLNFADACRELGAQIPAPSAARPEKKPKTTWAPILPVPSDAPGPPLAHVARGLPERTWCYRDASGVALGYVYRFVKSDGGKEVLPLMWARDTATGEVAWRWLAFPEPRPLYGLDRLAKQPDATILIVEGEKCADAASAELPNLAVVSWPGGGKAVGKVDWSPLAGRKVMLWADCDAKRVPLTPAEKAAGIEASTKPLLPAAEQPGVMAMAKVAQLLQPLGCRVWQVNIPAPGERADGWDIVDAVAEGLEGEALADFIRANLEPVAAAGTEEKTISTAGRAGAGSGDDDAWRGLLLLRSGNLVDCRENVYTMLKHHPDWSGVLWADEFARKIVKRKPAPFDAVAGFVPGTAWDNNDDLRLGMWLAQQEGLLIRSMENLAAAVAWDAAESPWHPVRDYLDALVWDGTPRVDFWLTDCLGVKRSEYTTAAGRMWLIGMVARIYRPGCPMRSMPILEGEQFRGKSTALRILGGEWFGDTPIDLNNKDAYQLIQGRWLYEIAELDAFNRAETTRIKSFISSPEDRFRAPYERAPRDWQRQTVFAGTTNQDEYFKDQTGNTRYWPLRCEEVERINLDALSAQRDQLFAEAVALFRAGERWHPTRDEQNRFFDPEQEAREIVDPWQTLIYKYLASCTLSRVTTTEILFDVLKVEPGKIDSTRQMSTRVGIAVKRIGWIKSRETDGSRGYFYARPEGWLESGEQNKNGGGHALPF